jgi:hypothetical protein
MAIVENGGTISHQHGVGSDHAPYLAAEKGRLGMSSLRALFEHVDPQRIMNPGSCCHEQAGFVGRAVGSGRDWRRDYRRGDFAGGGAARLAGAAGGAARFCVGYVEQVFKAGAWWLAVFEGGPVWLDRESVHEREHLLHQAAGLVEPQSFAFGDYGAQAGQAGVFAWAGDL